MALTLLCQAARTGTVWTLKRKPTDSDEARIKRLEDRLDAAVAESQRMRRELENLQRRDHPAQSSQLATPTRHPVATGMDTYNPDETVN